MTDYVSFCVCFSKNIFGTTFNKAVKTAENIQFVMSLTSLSDKLHHVLQPFVSAEAAAWVMSLKCPQVRPQESASIKFQGGLEKQRGGMKLDRSLS